GAQGMAVTVVPSSSFRWTSGTDSVVVWDKPGHDWQANFCSTCGSAVPGKNDESRMFIPVGSITEGGQALAVAHHIFVDSKAPWDTWADDGLKHPEGFGSGERGDAS
ncbi:MAG: GFA family protein, partial [Pseudomonadota bacterium]